MIPVWLRVGTSRTDVRRERTMTFSNRCGPGSPALINTGEPPRAATLDGTAAHSNNFLCRRRGRPGYDATHDAREIALAPLDRQSVRPQDSRNGGSLAHPDLAGKEAPRPHQPREVGRERSITAEPVRAAVKGTARVIKSDFAR